MKLTDALFRWKKALPRGNIWRGKYRLVKQVTGLDITRKREEFDLEEKNMFYLRHPYMTIEQDQCRTVSVNERQKFSNKKFEEKSQDWKPNKLLGDRFGFLKIADKWE